MSPNNELYSLCRDEQRFSIHILITRASEICYSFYLILQWKSGIISRGKSLILRLSLSPYSKMVFLERRKISKGLIKKSYWAQGKNPKAEQSEFPRQCLHQQEQEVCSSKAWTVRLLREQTAEAKRTGPFYIKGHREIKTETTTWFNIVSKSELNSFKTESSCRSDENNRITF